MSRLLGVLLCLTFLSGCSWLWTDHGDAVEQTENTEELSFEDSAFDDNDDEEVDNEPKELNSIDEKVEIKKIWRNAIGGSDEVYQATLHPALGDGVVYAASNKGRISAWPVHKGKRLWRTDLDLSLSGGVGFGAGLVAVGTAKGELIALDAETGDERWRVTLSSEILSAPAANGDLLVAQTQDGKVYGLSLMWAHVVWAT